MQIGYVDIWRWRMGGSGDPVEDYRNWMSSVVSSAAYAPAVALTRTGSADPAPLASLFASLGSPAAREAGLGAGDWGKMLLILFVVAIAALVVETASRTVGWKGPQLRNGYQLEAARSSVPQSLADFLVDWR